MLRLLDIWWLIFRILQKPDLIHEAHLWLSKKNLVTIWLGFLATQIIRQRGFLWTLHKVDWWNFFHSPFLQIVLPLNFAPCLLNSTSHANPFKFRSRKLNLDYPFLNLEPQSPSFDRPCHDFYHFKLVPVVFTNKEHFCGLLECQNGRTIFEPSA